MFGALDHDSRALLVSQCDVSTVGFNNDEGGRMSNTPCVLAGEWFIPGLEASGYGVGQIKGMQP